MLLHGKRGKASRRFRVGHIAGNAVEGHAQRLDLHAHLFQRSGLRRVEYEIHTLRRKSESDPPTNPPAGAGDNGGFAFQ